MVHKHRNLLAHAPKKLHDEISADYTDMIYAKTVKAVEARRKAFVRKQQARSVGHGSTPEVCSNALSAYYGKGELSVLVRRLPLLLLLKRPLRLGWADAVYLGWFGPIGVSAIFYLTLEAARIGVQEPVMAAGTMIVVLSTVSGKCDLTSSATWAVPRWSWASR